MLDVSGQVWYKHSQNQELSISTEPKSFGAFLLPEINMPKLIHRQIEQDEHGYYCIDTFDSNPDYPFCGFGYSEHEAIAEAERQARKQFNNRGESVTNLV